MTDAARFSLPSKAHVCLAAIWFGCIAVADFCLLSQALFLHGDGVLLAVAIPFGQCSLAAIYGATTRANAYVRFAIPPIGVVVSWWLLYQTFQWGLNDQVSAAWAVAMTMQTIVIILSIKLYHVASDMMARRRSEEISLDRSRAAFGVRSLILLTTVCGLGFGFMKLGHTRWGWSGEIADWEYLRAMPIVACANALVAMLCLWSLVAGTSKQRVRRILFIPVPIFLTGRATPYLIEMATGSFADGIMDFWITAVSQGVLISISIVAATAVMPIIARPYPLRNPAG